MGVILNYSKWSKLYEDTASTSPDLSSNDWSEGGTVVWESADLIKIIDYTIARDSQQEYSKLTVYKPVMDWFKENANDETYSSYIRDSLIIWLGEDPYYGLPTARKIAAESGSQYSEKPEGAVMDVATRQKLLVEITRKTNEKINNPIFRDSVPNGKTDLASVISQANWIEFYKEGEKKETKTIGEAKTVYINMQYPDTSLSEENRKTISENLFPDDGDKLGQSAVDGMYKAAENICLEWKKFKTENKGAELQSVEILTFASTSTVNSSYGTGGTVFNSQNNVKLAQARLNVMSSTLLEQVKRQSGNWGVNEIGEKVMVSASTNAANIGPGWETIGGKYGETTFTVDSYGPLFAAAVKAKPTITPKEFYSIKARKENPAIKAEYEAVYSTFRKSTASIRITAQYSTTTPEEKIITVVGQFEVLIEWPDNRKSKPAKGSGKVRYSKPKNTMPAFNGRSLSCPAFD